MDRGLSLWIVAMATIMQIISQAGSQTSVCLDQRTCGDCITAAASCSWCRQENFTANRCDLLSDLVNVKGCDTSQIVSPDHSMHKDKDEPPRDSDTHTDAIQLSPQEITVSLRPNKPFTFDATFRLAKNYPVDLYYVMDLSGSMYEDKKNLAKLGDTLAAEMRNITSNFQLGFGSFVDKPVMPFISINPTMLARPCGPNTTCVAAYGFKNQLSLTSETSKFKTQVQASAISGNADAPEGCFDAVMQAIMCESIIGWRQVSRKMVLVATDNSFHFAGDGKLAGIIKPNDGSCHLDSTGLYTESTKQDYPSISHLAYKIAEKKANVIFAVTKKVNWMYTELTKLIEGSVVGVLDENSENIVKLVADNYKLISGKVELKTQGAEGIQVHFKSRCQGSEFVDSAKCDHLLIGDNVTFQVTIQVDSCPKERSKWNRTFSIYPVGLADKLQVHVNMKCECDCEKKGQGNPNSPICSGSGTYQCGGCSCNDGHYGAHCQCNTTSAKNEGDESGCKRPNGTNLVCENNGRCACGQCMCSAISPKEPEKKWTGQYCGCNNYKCPRFNGQLCGGPSHGRCACGKCECNLAYTGDRCQCPKSDEPCRASNGVMCNGKGTCSCGRCTCTLDDVFRGQTCEDCPTCPGKCDEHKACVQCRAFQSGDLSPEYCAENCTHVKVVTSVDDLPQTKTCQFRGEDNCDYYFSYDYYTGDVKAQRTKECPEPVNVLAIVLGVIGGILAIGIVLLVVWKVCVTIHDKREFSKFENEKKRAQWDSSENPIYRQATTTFANPRFGD